MTTIRQAEGPDDMRTARALFQEYADWLGIDLSYQDFERELAELPGAYAPPKGRLLLGEVDGAAVGCIALRPLEPGIGEVKRLYLRPALQGRGLGRRLAETLVAEARLIGYRTLRLDTLARLTAANTLYASLGFRPIAPYYRNPTEGVL
ncbi:MAG: GNAT family N-acetyltransferase, partial [Candidatus Eiseniibacteriota bacterium]